MKHCNIVKHLNVIVSCADVDYMLPSDFCAGEARVVHPELHWPYSTGKKKGRWCMVCYLLVEDW
jgi:hypothetical protein